MPVDTRTCPKCQRSVMGKIEVVVGGGEAQTGGPFPTAGTQLQTFRCECGFEWSESITPPKLDDPSSHPS